TMKIVISLGGSLISLNEPDYIRNVADLIKKISDDFELYVVVGGGKLARNYINTARKFCNDELYLDRIGIFATRINALLLNTFFKKDIPETVEEVMDIKPPVIMGGTTPGHSTDAVSAMVARKVKAKRLIIATDVDGIYDKDPKKNKDAKKFDIIDIKELIKISGRTWKKAGESAVIDAIACRIIEEEKIPTFVLNGKNLKELENAIYGKKFNGTVVEIK
ncbi:MAG TPA: UMP kinase, partial [Thermoplasmatales archaeon]|nr:UMP kinase [Thermoplasmatales archaeon]